MLTREYDGPFHTLSIQLVGTAPPIPTLQSAEGSDLLGFGIDGNNSTLNRAHELRKAIQTVRIDAIPGGIGEKPRAQKERGHASLSGGALFLMQKALHGCDKTAL